VVFEHVVAALVHGSGYERIATPGCSDRTIRRRLAEWAEPGIAEALHAAALRAYDQIIGLELGDVAVDGCLTKAPCGGQRAGPSPAGRRKGGLKRSVASDGYGIPVGIASAPANRHDSPLLPPTLEAASQQLDGILPTGRTCHLDRGYDSTVTRQLLDELGLDGQIARKGIPAPIQAGPRWVVERTHSQMNGYGKLRRCTERNAKIADFCLYLAAALLTIRQLIQRARKRYRWDSRPTTKRLKLRLSPGALSWNLGNSIPRRRSRVSPPTYALIRRASVCLLDPRRQQPARSAASGSALRRVRYPPFGAASRFQALISRGAQIMLGHYRRPTLRNLRHGLYSSADQPVSFGPARGGRAPVLYVRPGGRSPPAVLFVPG
jgi:hypothetical protein